MNSIKLYKRLITQQPKIAAIYRNFRCSQSLNQLQFLQKNKTVDLEFFFKPRTPEPLIASEKNLVIECKNPKLNHYSGASYKPHNVPLASNEWFFNESIGDYFSILPSQPELSKDTFKSIGINESLVTQLEKLKIISPTVTQSKAIKEILNGKNILYIDERGSGKTLGCMIGIIQRIIQLKENPENKDKYALVLCPGKNSAAFLSETINSLVTDLGLKCNFIDENQNLDAQFKADIITCSTATLKNLQNSGLLENNLKFLVVQNVKNLSKTDSLFGFKLLRRLKSQYKVNGCLTDPNSLQMCWLTSVITYETEEWINEAISEIDLLPVYSSNFNKISRHVRQDFLRISHDNIMTELFKILNKNEEKKIPTLVFGLPPTIDDKKAEDVLKEKNISCATLVKEKYQTRKSSEIGFKIENEKNLPSLVFPEIQHVINVNFGRHLFSYLSKVNVLTRESFDCSKKITNFIHNPTSVPNVQKIEYLVRCDEKIPNFLLLKTLD